ncbi:zinc finger CCHC domain-containing protein 8 homolog [Sitodiplosis mosellana]|uniref:zinc finger CCHC domain-containing protein 8 homolog n=1 Tax=Sitodiplosis mosellana TaxID=263140 RepID=UPI002444CC2D|nr:zinc finger CCHC domain-containing protein 8 homolog [Sitodiplosis mosellana]
MEIQSEAITAPVQNDQVEEVITNGNDTVADDDVNMNASENSSHQVNGSHSETNTENDCLVRLVFRDSSTFDELHQVIGQCIRDALFSLQKRANLIVEKSENCVKINEISDDNEESMFMVDTLPTENANESEVPDYNSSQLEMHEEEATSNDAEADDGGKPKMGNCWNCGGDHTMKDCKEKRDSAAISRAKQSFIQKTRTERYHLEAEQKYSHLVPGQLSDNLRQALGLRSRELPLFIYKMRLYGYPLGWLEEAKINHSGLSLFHSEDTSSDDKKDDEDGEVDKVEYDASKFIEYPGFNAAIPSNLIDDGDYYRVPPMIFEHSKEGLIQSLQNNLTKTYKRKRLKLDVNETPAIDNVKGDDMDIEASDSENTPMLFPQPRPVLDESNSNTVADEASLLELERRQEELRKALEDANSSDSNSLPSDQNNQQQNDDNETPQPESNEATQEKSNETIESNSNQNNTVETDSPESPTGDEFVTEVSIAETTAEFIETTESVAILNTPVPSTTGHSRESVSGTPLIKQVSPFTRLPGGEMWSVGVSDVIDFENLPEATGKYGTMKGLIDKVRTVVKRINDDTEHDSS